MTLDVWYPQDVINILRALASAGELQGPEYHKALDDVALAFGIALEGASIETPSTMPGVKGLLPWRVVDEGAVGGQD
jgi:hypothetical protein